MDDTAKNLLRQIGATEELQTWESLYKYNSLFRNFITAYNMIYIFLY